MVAKTAAECVYDDQKISYPMGFEFLCDAEDPTTGQQLGDTVSAVELSAHALTNGKFAGAPSPPGFYAKLTPAHFTPVHIATDERNRTSGQRDVLAHCRPSRTGISSGQHTDGTPFVSVLPSFLHPSIPPDLRVNLSFLGEENLQVRSPEVDATDTDMKSCVLG